MGECGLIFLLMQLNNDFWPTSLSVSQSGLRGNNIQIRVTIKNDQGNENRLDDIKVTGQTYKADLCYGSSQIWEEPVLPTGPVLDPPVISYTWTPSVSLDDPTIANPVANPTSDVIWQRSLKFI